MITHTCGVVSDLGVVVLRECECGHDEAVGVDDVARDGPVVGRTLHHARDLAPVAHPLQARHQQRAPQEQDHGRPEGIAGVSLVSFSLKALGR